MKVFYFLLFVTYFATSGCMSAKKAIDTIVLEENQKKGTVLHLPRKTSEGLQTEKEFYFRIDNVNYFIKFSESNITPSDLKKHVNKTLVIEGEIKNGLWETQKTRAITSNKQSEKQRGGMYITIDKILNKKDLIP